MAGGCLDRFQPGRPWAAPANSGWARCSSSSRKAATAANSAPLDAGNYRYVRGWRHELSQGLELSCGAGGAKFLLDFASIAGAKFEAFAGVYPHCIEQVTTDKFTPSGSFFSPSTHHRWKCRAVRGRAAIFVPADVVRSPVRNAAL